MAQLAILKNNSLHLETRNWMENYFTSYGDSQPNRTEIHLETSIKRDIWKEYALERQHDGKEFMSYQAFCELWATNFNHVKIREYKQVTGKCWTCAFINQARASSETSLQIKLLKEIHALHRGGLYMLERNE
jgi:hypothetical protein